MRREEYTIPTLFTTNCLVYMELLVDVVNMVVLVATMTLYGVDSSDQVIVGAGLPYAIQLATILVPISAMISTLSETKHNIVHENFKR